jgi:hypothetical protein
MVRITQERVYKKVRRIEPWNTLSRNMTRKLFRPLKEGGLKPSQFVKLKISEKTTGISTNMRNPVKFGMIKDKPTKVFLAVNE